MIGKLCPDCPPAGLPSSRMGDGDDPTELAPSETDTASVRAWGLSDFDDEDEPAEASLKAEIITATAVGASVVAIVIAGLIAWEHFSSDDTSIPVAASSSMVTATTMTATPVALPPPPPPTPAPVTITTVIKQIVVPTTAAQAAPAPTAALAAYDDQFLNKLVAEGWNITSAAAMAKNAHLTCGLLRQGNGMDYINGQLMAGAAMTSTEASLFSSTVMSTYPDCP
jgi:hypothetical protein